MLKQCWPGDAEVVIVVMVMVVVLSGDVVMVYEGLWR